eukprot:TRINITY_DN8005_c0_g1_i1.p1 TRINITY_DN8005_c0_g1~~TRINITY_DN8005_c0_g1_i1.p1  ORF type:complete len:460 (-),score=92.58 TRINITY_DN8005_c0_g1_i1:274-1653(-)
MPFCCGGASTRRVEKIVDEDWKVGGRFRVNRSTVVYATEELYKENGTLTAKEVLILERMQERGKEIALVMPQPAYENTPGWICLEEEDGPNTKGGPVLDTVRQEGSWEMKARYTVQNPSTVRAGAELTSEWVAELEPGQEVLVLELTVSTTRATDGKARLRALVNAGGTEGVVGWLSPETSNGDHLLYPVNLLSEKVVDVHKQSLRLSRSKSASGGVRKSFQAAGEDASSLPWEVGGAYRTLEQALGRQSEDPRSEVTYKVPAGTIVTVQQVAIASDGKSRYPCALVTADRGNEGIWEGWVRCSAPDGHDIIDSRDQHEYQRVLQKMRQSVSGNLSNPQDANPSQLQADIIQAQRAAMSMREDAERTAQDTDQVEMVDSPPAPEKAREYWQAQDSKASQNAEEPETSQVKVSAKQQEVQEKLSLSRLGTFDTEPDDKLMPDPRVQIEKESLCCSCACTK